MTEQVDAQVAEGAGVPTGGRSGDVAFEVVGLGSGAGFVDYRQAWDLQRAVHARVSSGRAPDTVLLLEHSPVFTAGKRTEPHERPVDGTPVIDVDRGGKITWHGPGQLVGYPIVRLERPIDVVGYVRKLEQALIAICADMGVQAGVVAGRTGVWLPADDETAVVGAAPAPRQAPVGGRRERKIAAIGIRVAQGVTMHGFAINCNPDLSWFGRIIPCGIDDADVTSLSVETGRDVTVDEVVPLAERHLRRVLTPSGTATLGTTTSGTA